MSSHHTPSQTCFQVLSLVRKLKRVRAGSTDDGGDLLVSAEEFVSFVGGEYEAAEAAQGRLRRVLKLAGEKEGISLEGAFGALDKVGGFILKLIQSKPRLRRSWARLNPSQ